MSPVLICFAKHETGRRAVELLVALRAPVRLVILSAAECDAPWFSRIRETCAAAGIELAVTERLSKDQALIEKVRRLKPDLAFTVMFTQIIPSSVIQSCRLGIINFHPSKLPAYRGPHPVNWAIVNGEKEHGVTAHFVTEKVDAGPILMADVFPIKDSDTNITLQKVIDDTVMAQLRRSYELFCEGSLMATPQDESRASYFPMRGPEDGRIFWNSMNAAQIYNLCRALQPPIYGSFFDYNGVRVIVRKCRITGVSSSQLPGTVLGVSGQTIEMATCEGTLMLEEVEIEGKQKSDDAQGLFKAGARVT